MSQTLAKRAAKWGVVTAAVLGLLTACDDVRAPAAPGEGGAAVRPAAAAFSHDISGDLSGDYRPVSEVMAGGHRLTHLYLGQTADFERWHGGARSGGFAPVMIEFANASGGTVRVMPDSYRVEDGRVRFSGTNHQLGTVSFDGRLDQGALATARRNLGEEAPVLTGVLRVGDRTLSGQTFRWYGGD